MATALGTAQSRQSGWITLRQNFNNAVSVDDKLNILHNVMNGDTVTISQSHTISSRQTRSSPDFFTRIYNKFQAKYSEFKRDQIENLKLEFFINQG